MEIKELETKINTLIEKLNVIGRSLWNRFKRKKNTRNRIYNEPT